MAVLEKKIFTNVYWNKTKHDIVVMGMYGTEASADKKIIKDDANLVFNRTIPATLQFEVNWQIIIEGPPVSDSLHSVEEPKVVEPLNTDT